MRNELGDLFLRARINLGLTLQELARRAGYRNRDKGARRFERLERDGVAASDHVARAAAALGIEPQQVAEAKARDDATRQADFAAWLLVPQPMRLIGMVAGIALPFPLPEGLSDEQAIAYAASAQGEHRLRMCLVLDRRRSLWISSGGESRIIETSPDSPNFPYSRVG